MSMFTNPSDEERLCQVLRAYIEEWGPENVVIAVPSDWQEFSSGTLGSVRLEFGDRNRVSIRVEYEAEPRLKYDVLIKAA